MKYFEDVVVFSRTDKATSPTCHPGEYASAETGETMKPGVADPRMVANKYFADDIPFYDEQQRRGSRTGKFVPQKSRDAGSDKPRGTKEEGRAQKQQEATEKRARA